MLRLGSIGAPALRIGAGLLATERVAILGVAGLSPNTDSQTLSLLGTSPSGGHLENSPDFIPGGTVATGGDVEAVVFVPNPGQTLVIAGEWKGPTASGAGKSFNIVMRYAFGVCRDLGSDPPGGVVVLTHRIEVTRTDGATGSDTLTMSAPRFSASNSGGAPTFVRSLAGICSNVGGTAFGGAPGDVVGGYGPAGAGCAHVCPGTPAGCRNVWLQMSRNLTGAGLGGHTVSWRHVLEVTETCAVQLVSTE